MDHPSKPYPNPNVTTTYPAQSYPSQTYAQQAYPSTAGGASTYTTTTVQQSRTVLVRPYFDVNVSEIENQLTQVNLRSEV